MARKLPSVGIKLSLDGLREIQQRLNRLTALMRKAATKAAKPFQAIGAVLSRALRPAFTAITKLSSFSVRALTKAGQKGGTAFAKGVAKGVAKAARSVKSLSGTALKVGAVGGIGGIGVNLASGIGIAESIQEQSRLAKTSGTTLKKFSQLSAVVRNFGLENDDLSGALADLSEKLDDAANGNEGLIELFKRAGIAIKTEKGELRDAVDVFLDIPDALRKFKTQTERSSVATQLIAGDAEKLSEVLALSTDALKQRMRLANETGITVTQDEVDRARDFLDAWNSLKNTFFGIFQGAFTNVFPVINRLLYTVRDILQENRILINNLFVDGVARFTQLLTDLLNALVGNRNKVVNTWIFDVAYILRAIGRTIASVTTAFAKFGPTIAKAFKSGLKYMRDFSAAFLGAFGGRDLVDNLFGENVKRGERRFVSAGLTQNGRFRGVRRRLAREGERVIPFKVDENTANVAEGFAGALTSLQQRFLEVWEPLKIGFSNFATYTQTTIIPFFGLLWRAINGDEQAKQEIFDKIKAQIDLLLLERPKLKDFWEVLTGKKEYEGSETQKTFDGLLEQFKKYWADLQTEFGKFLDGIIAEIDKRVEDTEAAKGFWYILTGRSAEVDPSENWVVKFWNDAKEVITDFEDTVLPILRRINETMRNLMGTDNAIYGWLATLMALRYGPGAAKFGLQSLAGLAPAMLPKGFDPDVINPQFIPEGSYRDSNGKLRRANGQFMSKAELDEILERQRSAFNAQNNKKPGLLSRIFRNPFAQSAGGAVAGAGGVAAANSAAGSGLLASITGSGLLATTGVLAGIAVATAGLIVAMDKVIGSGDLIKEKMRQINDYIRDVMPTAWDGFLARFPDVTRGLDEFIGQFKEMTGLAGLLDGVGVEKNSNEFSSLLNKALQSTANLPNFMRAEILSARNELLRINPDLTNRLFNGDLITDPAQPKFLTSRQEQLQPVVFDMGKFGKINGNANMQELQTTYAKWQRINIGGGR